MTNEEAVLKAQGSYLKSQDKRLKPLKLKAMTATLKRRARKPKKCQVVRE